MLGDPDSGESTLFRGSSEVENIPVPVPVGPHLVHDREDRELHDARPTRFRYKWFGEAPAPGPGTARPEETLSSPTLPRNLGGLVDQFGRSPVLQTGGLGFKSRPVHSSPQAVRISEDPARAPVPRGNPVRGEVFEAGDFPPATGRLTGAMSGSVD
jgi:hypothetical protein